MSERLEAALAKFEAARKAFSDADDELYLVFQPIVEEAAKKGAHAVHEALTQIPDSITRFRLWREFRS